METKVSIEFLGLFLRAITGTKPKPSKKAGSGGSEESLREEE